MICNVDSVYRWLSIDTHRPVLGLLNRRANSDLPGGSHFRRERHSNECLITDCAWAILGLQT